MIHILAQIHIQDYTQFITVFTTKGKEIRQKHGCLQSQIFSTANPQQLTIFFGWTSQAAFESFLTDPLTKETMKASGTLGPPTFIFLDKICELPA
ncbi:putative quinol monooxygenase [Tellurirhabdus bombi]|uniref:putative quinol monooxygenase n=1 Tax=Tellurirhabdus bombi TaxID=2907205 RepID=UPI001F39318E|nr:antibiotic biosynthesis monooxygenase [Tellurirhabdus bombi]